MTSFGFLPAEDKEAVASYLLGEEPPAPAAKGGDEAPAPGIPYTHTGYNRFLDPQGYPAVKPPWGTLNAIDLSAGVIDWTVPLGELPELKQGGLPPTGTENYGGPVVTAGGLLFIGATKDEKLRAFDKRTGKVLWETSLPAGGYATPATYAVGGRQYVVIAAGGGKMGTKSGDAYVAFALPRAFLGAASDASRSERTASRASAALSRTSTRGSRFRRSTISARVGSSADRRISASR
jgi:quinoprotein glucose dehydrogenase